MTYIGDTTFKHGADFGDPPTGTVVLAVGEEITSIFGHTGYGIHSMGFTTSLGAIYGPWGQLENDEYLIAGPVYGFFGGMWGDILTSFGIWTTDPRATTLRPAPNPPGMMRSIMYGGSSLPENQWDDGSTMIGNPQLLFMRCSDSSMKHI